MGIVLSDEENDCIMECKSLLINLALDKRNAQLITGDTGQGLKIILGRAYEQQDFITMKLVRNITFHQDTVILPYFLVSTVWIE